MNDSCNGSGPCRPSWVAVDAFVGDEPVVGARAADGMLSTALRRDTSRTVVVVPLVEHDDSKRFAPYGLKRLRG
jgi:hypothetical protein